MAPDTPEALNAQLLGRIVELEREVVELRAERDTLLAAQQGVTPTSVHEALQAVLAQHNGKISATARALGYAAPGTFRRIQPRETGSVSPRPPPYRSGLMRCRRPEVNSRCRVGG